MSSRAATLMNIKRPVRGAAQLPLKWKREIKFRMQIFGLVLAIIK